MGSAQSNTKKTIKTIKNVEYLDIDKNINVIIKTKIGSDKITKNDETKIKKYIKNIIESMGAASYDYISNYIIIKKISLDTTKKNILINLILHIDKNGKKIKAHSGKKLIKDKLKEECTKKKLKEHILWSLNESSYRSEPLKLSKINFVLPQNKIDVLII